MPRMTVTVTARQRISMGTGTGKAFQTRAHQHVPGSVWRGALARAWLERLGTTDAVFRDVFDRRLRFGPLFATGTALRPQSVRSCKYGAGHCAIRALDAAFPVPADLVVPADWVEGHWEDGRGEVVGGPDAVTTTTTAILHATGTAAPRQLFSREALETGTTFTGEVAGDDETLSTLAKAALEVERIELGGRTSVLGSASITVAEASSEPARAAAPSPVRDYTTLAVRLMSPAILVDPAGRPTLDLRQALAGRGIRGTIGRVWARPTTQATGGFHAASRLPKPVDVAVAAGATVVIDPAPGDEEVLTAVADTGLGLRRAEGFGWVRVDADAWTWPESVDHDPRDARSDDGGSDGRDNDFARLRDLIRGLHLGQTHRRWLAAVLGEDLSEEGRVTVLRRPGAAGLTGQQLDIVATLLSQPRHRRDQLAHEIRRTGLGGQA